MTHSDRNGTTGKMKGTLALLVVAALAAGAGVPSATRAEGMAVDEAIRAAWRHHPGLAASTAQVEAARADAAAARDARLPALTVTAKGVATDEPMTAFGLRLDQQRIGAADFAPARLNSPALIGGVGLGASVAMPIYAGGRLAAGRDAAMAQAGAEARSLEWQRQEAALAVVQTYFAAQASAQAVRHAEEQLGQARETERFVTARNRQGLVLDADVARAVAFRAQAEAELASTRQQLASARSGLALLAGEEAAGAELTSRLEEGSPAPGTARGQSGANEPGSGPGPAGLPSDRVVPAPRRPDLDAARLRVDAARSAVVAARGSLLPQISAQAGVETMRSALDQGATWVSLGVVARWQLGLAELHTTDAAQARARAAESALRWQEDQARREVDEARRAVETADLRVASALEAVAASESARSLRIARHRQGLLPLTDVLDAEAGLAGARALLVHSRLEARVARARLELAMGRPVEGVQS